MADKDFPRKTGRDREDYADFARGLLAGEVRVSKLLEVLTPTGTRQFSVRVFTVDPKGDVVTEEGERGRFEFVTMTENTYALSQLKYTEKESANPVPDTKPGDIKAGGKAAKGKST